MQPVLETERLILRPFLEGDFEPFHAICSDPRVMQFVGNRQPWSREQTRAFIDRAVAQARQYGYCQWPMVLKEDRSLIGFCGFARIDEQIEIGWRLAVEHWGKGLATEAARAALDYGFATLGFEHVRATVQPGNEASLRVALKLGMRPEGTIPRHGRELLVFGVSRQSRALG